MPHGVAVLYGGGGVVGAALRTLLLPAELLFRAASRGYHAAYDSGLMPATSVARPVISVGNLTIGGAGKTPVVRWLVRELKTLGRRPAVLHGGYAEDEPALHRHWHPDVQVRAERSRVRAAGQAIAAGADVLVLDDAFQHRRIARDLDLVVIAAEHWRTRPRLLPCGPWREPPRALRRADVVVVTRRTADERRAVAVEHAVGQWFGGPTARVWLRPAGWTRFRARDAAKERSARPAGPVLAVTAIADPGAFLDNACAAGAQIEDRVLFRDHHDFTRSDVDALRAAAAGRDIVTTEKDAVKLNEVAPDLRVWVLEQELVLESGAGPLLAAVRSAVAR
ncbi:MAG: tetraacyldisaccharide 4'-kinase [Longimicrobiales bacterium]